MSVIDNSYIGGASGNQGPNYALGTTTPYDRGGTTYGYLAGGYPAFLVIDRWSFTSDGNASGVGNLDKEMNANVSWTKDGQYGYTAGTTRNYMSPGDPNGDEIQRYSFASSSNASTVQDMNYPQIWAQGSSSETHGYAHGGNRASPPYTSSSAQPESDRIDRYNFATNAAMTDVGDLAFVESFLTGAQSLNWGYCIGGFGNIQDIQRYSFTFEADAKDVGDLVVGRYGGGGASSTTHGYYMKGNPGLPYAGGLNSVEKWSFSSDGNATNVSTMGALRNAASGNNSTTYGYCMGGSNNLGATQDNIDKIAFSNDSSTADIGNLTSGRQPMTNGSWD